VKQKYAVFIELSV